VQVADLSATVQDPLLSRVRNLLRREYGFPKEPKKKFGVECVYSAEPSRQVEVACDADAGSHPSGLNCAGYGSATSVTAVFGMAAVARVLQVL